jgi:hypothetical protein
MKQVIILLIVNTILSLHLFGQYKKAAPNNAQFNAVVGRSTFIFVGTILYMDSTDIKANIRQRKAIVKVDTVIDASGSDRKLQGKTVTVIFSSNAPHHNGKKQVFYTYVWSYGRSVGVIEVKNNFTTITPGLTQKVKDARQQIADDTLSAQLKRSVIVAKCYVIRIEDSVYNSIFASSEHNPLFRKAVFKISELLKGKPQKANLSAYFASSSDPMWYRSPKLSDSTEAIFLFNQSTFPAFMNLSGLVLLDPRDVQPNSELDRIKRLLNTPKKAISPTNNNIRHP